MDIKTLNEQLQKFLQAETASKTKKVSTTDYTCQIWTTKQILSLTFKAANNFDALYRLYQVYHLPNYDLFEDSIEEIARRDNYLVELKDEIYELAAKSNFKEAFNELAKMYEEGVDDDFVSYARLLFLKDSKGKTIFEDEDGQQEAEGAEVKIEDSKFVDKQDWKSDMEDWKSAKYAMEHEDNGNTFYEEADDEEKKYAHGGVTQKSVIFQEFIEKVKQLGHKLKQAGYHVSFGEPREGSSEDVLVIDIYQQENEWATKEGFVLVYVTNHKHFYETRAEGAAARLGEFDNFQDVEKYLFKNLFKPSASLQNLKDNMDKLSMQMQKDGYNIIFSPLLREYDDHYKIFTYESLKDIPKHFMGKIEFYGDTDPLRFFGNPFGGYGDRYLSNAVGFEKLKQEMYRLAEIKYSVI